MSASEAPHRFLSYREAEAFLGVSRATFGRLVQDGELPVVQVSARRRVVDPRDLAAFAENRKVRRVPKNDDGAEATAPTVTTPPGDEVAGRDPG
ncbi:MAG TPA: helix-turn-helix domain-containing protein [Gaiellaceae bacterium]|nr:helix-turn-helix domain-containing protein [Gaiellaceae bacterium]